jgi:hypothetical protein
MTESRLPRPSGSAAPETQHDRFVEAARALGCDEDEAAFDEKLKAITRSKPKSEAKKTEE